MVRLVPISGRVFTTTYSSAPINIWYLSSRSIGVSASLHFTYPASNGILEFFATCITRLFIIFSMYFGWEIQWQLPLFLTASGFESWTTLSSFVRPRPSCSPVQKTDASRQPGKHTNFSPHRRGSSVRPRRATADAGPNAIVMNDSMCYPQTGSFKKPFCQEWAQHSPADQRPPLHAPPVTDKECVLCIVYRRTGVVKRLIISLLKVLQVRIKAAIARKRLRQVEADFTVLSILPGVDHRD